MDKTPVSVVVLTKNEEARIEKCLESVKWADEIIVIDDESTDRTIEKVKRYTDKIFIKKMDIEGRHRNWAYANAKNTWVLSLDADEMVSDELKVELEELFKEAGKRGTLYILPTYTALLSIRKVLLGKEIS